MEGEGIGLHRPIMCVIAGWLATLRSNQHALNAERWCGQTDGRLGNDMNFELFLCISY